MEFERVKRSHTHIDIAPLVDMVFLLLLFFMLTYHIVADYGIEVRLPEAATAVAQDSGQVEIVIGADETIFIEGTPVSLDELPLLLKGLFVSAQQPLVIRADRDSNVGLLVGIIDAGRLSGFSSISVLTEKK